MESIEFYKIKSVVRKFDLSSFIISLTILLFASFSFAANKARMEKTLMALIIKVSRITLCDSLFCFAVFKPQHVLLKTPENS
jgi:hypothetical protein